MHKEEIAVNNDVSLLVYSRSPLTYEGLFLGYPLAEASGGFLSGDFVQAGIDLMVSMERRMKNDVNYVGFVPLAEYDPKKGLVQILMGHTNICPLFSATLVASPDEIASQMYNFIDENFSVQLKEGFDPAVVFAAYKYGLCPGHVVNNAINRYGLGLLEKQREHIEHLRSEQHTDDMLEKAFKKHRGTVQLPIVVKEHIVDLIYQRKTIEDFFGL